MGRWWGHPQREESLGWEKEYTSGLQHVKMEVLLPQLDEGGELRVRHTGLLMAEGGAMAKTGQRMNDMGRKSGGRRKGRKKGEELDFKVK